jgi:leucine dehydrogenase
VDAQVFAPCALGAIVNDDTIPQFKFEIIAGAANNQLAEERHGDLLCTSAASSTRPTT